MNVFAPKSCRVISYLLLHANKPLNQKEIAENTKLTKGLVSRIMKELIQQGFVSRPYRARFILDQPNELLLKWVGARNIRTQKAYFSDTKKILSKVRHVHTLFSGAWFDVKYLKTRFTTVYVSPNFKSKLKEGRVSELKEKIILIPALDEYVFYNTRKINRKEVVNPYQLFVDLASFNSIAKTVLPELAKKYNFPKLE